MISIAPTRGPGRRRAPTLAVGQFLLAVAAGAALALALHLPAAPAAAQPAPDSCALLGPEATDPSRETGFPTGGESCRGDIGGNTALVYLFKDAAAARAFLDREAQGTPSMNLGARPSAAHGETGLELYKLNQSARVVGYEFSRGSCIGGVVSPEAVGTPLKPPTEAVGPIAARLDGRLKAAPRCHGAAVPAPAAPAGPLAVGLACDTNALAATGRIVCAAAASNARPDAQLAYEWTVDGQVRADQSGNQLTENVAVGAHRIGVVARDRRNNLSSAPESVAFTRPAAPTGGNASGASGVADRPGSSGKSELPPPPILGPGSTTSGRSDQSTSRSPSSRGVSDLLPFSWPSAPTGPLVAGSALAIAAALGLLGLSRLGRRQPPPRQPRPAPPPPVRAPPPPTRPEALAAPPPTRPEVLAAPPPTPVVAAPPKPRQERRPRSQPQISVSLLVSPSIRTQAPDADGTIRLWADGVDLLFAGYQLTVTPPDWTLAEAAPSPSAAYLDTWSATGDGGGAGRPTITPVHKYAFSPTVQAVYGEPTEARQVVVQAPWCERGYWLSLRVTGTVRVKHTDGTEESVPFDSAGRPGAAVWAVGAAPRLELAPDREGLADGTTTVTIRPTLFVFDVAYAGGLAIEAPPDERVFEPYLALSGEMPWLKPPIPGAYDPIGAQQQQAPQLRCKFHLEDDAFKKLALHPAAPPAATRGKPSVAREVPIAFTVRPTGAGLGADSHRTAFDSLVADHYRACAVNLPGHIPAPAPARVVLHPSTIEVKVVDPDTTEAEVAPDLPHLPRAGAPSDRLYLARVTATVRSAAGAPVRGSDIRRDRPSGVGGTITEIQGWSLRFAFEAPTQAPLSHWDATPLAHPPLPVADVDEQGRLTFQGQGDPNPIPWYDYDHWKFFDPTTRYLRNQCGTVKTAMYADGENFDGATISVWSPCKLYVYVDNPPKTIEYGHVFIGLIDERGREYRVGFAGAENLYLPRAVTEGGDPVIGTLVGSVGGTALGAAASIAILAFFPAGTVAAASIKIISAAATLGTGMVVGQQLSVARGELGDDGNHSFHVCRGWDITKAEYDVALEKVKAWKRRSDTNDLLYDVAGVSGVGNCASFALEVFNSVGIPLPFARVADFTRPGNVAGRLDNDPRAEQNPGYSRASYKCPWTYTPGVSVSHVPISSLGSWKPSGPAAPLAPAQSP